MRTTIAILIGLSLQSSAWAAPVALPGLLNDAQLESLQAIHASMARWTSVYLRADCWGGSSCNVAESGLRVDLRGWRASGGHFSFDGWAGNQSVHVDADPLFNDPRRGYNLMGTGANLSLRPSGNGYWLTGFMGRRSVSVTFDRFGSSWSMFGESGLNLSLSGFNGSLNASGSVDAEQFGPQELAVFGSVLSVLATLPPSR